jgi:hypothetical protein
MEGYLVIMLHYLLALHLYEHGVGANFNMFGVQEDLNDQVFQKFAHINKAFVTRHWTDYVTRPSTAN